MRRHVFLVVALSSLTLASGSGASRQEAMCQIEQLAFSFPPTSAPTQHGAVGFGVRNTGRACRLALPISLELQSAGGRPLKTRPARSVLTLAVRSFRPRARALVVWEYTNYCRADRAGQLPIRPVVRVGAVELRGSATGAPCYEPARPIDLRVLFACPGARGPAIDAVTPRSLPLCPSR